MRFNDKFKGCQIQTDGLIYIQEIVFQFYYL